MVGLVGQRNPAPAEISTVVFTSIPIYPTMMEDGSSSKNFITYIIQLKDSDKYKELFCLAFNMFQQSFWWWISQPQYVFMKK